MVPRVGLRSPTLGVYLVGTSYSESVVEEAKEFPLAAAGAAALAAVLFALSQGRSGLFSIAWGWHITDLASRPSLDCWSRHRDDDTCVLHVPHGSMLIFSGSGPQADGMPRDAQLGHESLDGPAATGIVDLDTSGVTTPNQSVRKCACRRGKPAVT